MYIAYVNHMESILYMFLPTVLVNFNCVNKPVKTFLNDEFHNQYAGEMLSQIDTSHQHNVRFKPVQFPLIRMKPIAAQWIIDARHYISTHPIFIRNEFCAAGKPML